jgi:N-acetylmuramoyl-L-alanine amidase
MRLTPTKTCVSRLIMGLAFICIFSGFARSQNEVNGTQLAEKYSSLVNEHLIKDDTLFNWFSINEEGISIYANPESKSAGDPEFKLWWNELKFVQDKIRFMPEDEAVKWYLEKKDNPIGEAVIQRWREGILDDVGSVRLPRVAIDPGHTGGEESFAKMEKKYMRMKAGTFPGQVEEIAFNEGNLTMATAFSLKDLLETDFYVMSTRNGYGLTAFGCTFEEWLSRSYPSALEMYIKDCELTPEQEKAVRAKTTPEQIFHSVFKYAEFKERARLIQKFEPDIIIAIHYNVDEKNVCDKAGYYKPVDKNFSMCFVAGAWASGELETVRNRYQFLANLILNSYNGSVKISSAVEQRFVKDLGVPAMPYDSTIKYLDDYSLPTEYEGVFSRNLAFTRLINGAICFGETLYQDNIAECILLNQKTIDYHGWLGPQRVQQVATAYYQGILDYLRQR